MQAALAVDGNDLQVEGRVPAAQPDAGQPEAVVGIPELDAVPVVAVRLEVLTEVPPPPPELPPLAEDPPAPVALVLPLPAPLTVV